MLINVLFHLLYNEPYFETKILSYNNPLNISKDNKFRWVYIAIQDLFSLNSLNIEIKNIQTPMSYNHFYTDFDNFIISTNKSSFSSPAIIWFLPDGLCETNFSVIGTREKISARLYINYQFPLCLFSENLETLQNLNISNTSLTYKIYSNNNQHYQDSYQDSNIKSPFLIYLTPQALSSDIIIKYTVPKDDNLKDLCQFEQSPYFNSTSFVFPNGLQDEAFVRNCEIKNQQNAWWINFAMIGSLFCFVLCFSLYSFIRFHFFSSNTPSNSSNLSNSLISNSKKDDDLESIPNTSEKTPTTGNDIIFFHRASSE